MVKSNNRADKYILPFFGSRIDEVLEVLLWDYRFGRK
jgi:hypothetical protein